MDVTVIGYLFHPTGMGEHMRGQVRALQAVGLNPKLIDVADDKGHRDPDLEREFLPHLVETPVGGVHIYCVNGDEAGRVIARIGERTFAAAYNIAYPAWELARYPQPWAKVLRRFDEIWAMSAFIKNAIAKTVPRPVHHAPLPVEMSFPAFLGRRHFGIPDDAFVVLFFFDFLSFVERKNPGAVLDAVEQVAARRPDAPVHFVIKTRGGERAPDALAALTERLAALGPRTTALHGALSDMEIKNLSRVSDVFVSLHRSEGFGRGIAEAMFLGKPAIATGYSGNMDFMTPETSLAVDYQLVPVPPGAYPHGEGQVWADPSPEHAARLIEQLLDDPAGARAMGERAKRHLRTHFSNRATGLRHLDRLQAISRL